MIVKINYKEELKGDIKETYQKLEQQQKKWTDDNKEKKKTRKWVFPKRQNGREDIMKEIV